MKILTWEWARIIAWYVTEGSASSNAVQFTVSNDEVEYLQQVISSIGVKFSVSNSKSSSCSCMIICDCFLVDFFKTHCGTCAQDKRIPLMLISGHQELFLRELIKGDGCVVRYKEKSERWSYSTISRTLAYQVQLLANSVGLTAGVHKSRGSLSFFGRDTAIQGKDRYNVQIGHVEIRQNSTFLIRAKNCVSAKTVSKTTEHFDGDVYNIKVQHDESYTINGRSVHNCSFTLGVEGSYYAKYMQDARDENRLSNVKWNRQQRVYTSWDIGYGDSCAIIFYQLCGNEIHIIDYYENSGEGLPHYAGVLKDKPYLYGSHYAPHDIESHAFSSGLSAREVGADLGIKFITLPTLKLRLEDGIEALRGLFPRIWIDENKCKQLIKCLENYRKEFDQRLEIYKDRPRHDKWSHGADAARYLSIAVKLHVDGGKSGVDDEQSEKWFKQFNPRFD